MYQLCSRIVFNRYLAWGDLVSEDKGVIGGNTFPNGFRFGGVTVVVSEPKVLKRVGILIVYPFVKML